MSIRAAADAAINAENAKKEADRKANWNRHAQHGVSIAEGLLGLKVKCLRAYNVDPYDAELKYNPVDAWGDKTTIAITDEDETIYVNVRFDSEWVSNWGSAKTKVVKEPYLVLVNEKGNTLDGPGHYAWDEAFDKKNRIRSLADLGKALKAYDAWKVETEKKHAEYEARKAAKV